MRAACKTRLFLTDTNKDYKYLCKRETKYGILELLIQEVRVYGQPYFVLF